MPATPSQIWKIVMLGPGAVGKSSLTIQYAQGLFCTDYDPTIEDAYRKQSVIDGVPCVLDLLDTAGQEEYKSLRDHYVSTGHAFVVVFDLTKRSTMDEVDTFIETIRRVKDRDDGIPISLVGNKCDLVEDRVVPGKEARHLASFFGVEYYEASAKERVGVTDIFDGIVRQCRSLLDDKRKTRKRRASDPGRVFRRGGVVSRSTCRLL